MDLLLRGRGAEIGARAPLWFLRLCGAAAGFAIFALADWIGLTEVTGLSPKVAGAAAIAIGAMLAAGRFGALLWWAMIALSATMFVAGTTPVMLPAALHYVRHDSDNDPVDAVVVLSGSMTEEGLLSGPVISRFISGINEARERNVGVMALSVIDNSEREGKVTSEADQQALARMLAPGVSVQFVRGVNSTHDEALQFSALANTNRWHRVALVTSPLHSRRSCRTFEKAGLTVTCVPAQAREYALTSRGGMHARLNVFRDVMYETAATLVYSIRGWI